MPACLQSYNFLTDDTAPIPTGAQPGGSSAPFCREARSAGIGRLQQCSGASRGEECLQVEFSCSLTAVPITSQKALQAPVDFTRKREVMQKSKSMPLCDTCRAAGFDPTPSQASTLQVRKDRWREVGRPAAGHRAGAQRFGCGGGSPSPRPFRVTATAS